MFKTPKHALRKQNNQEQRGNKVIKEENVTGFEEDVCRKFFFLNKNNNKKSKKKVTPSAKS